jgi:hypothetical protein
VASVRIRYVAERFSQKMVLLDLIDRIRLKEKDSYIRRANFSCCTFHVGSLVWNRWEPWQPKSDQESNGAIRAVRKKTN